MILSGLLEHERQTHSDYVHAVPLEQADDNMIPTKDYLYDDHGGKLASGLILLN